MPLPFILAGAAIAAAGFGVKKGLDAKSDFESANYYNNKARTIFDESSAELNDIRENAQKSLEDLGELKLYIYENGLIPFVEEFSKIKNINFNDNRLVGVTSLPEPTQAELAEITEHTLAMKGIVTGGVTALGSGGLAGLAAYGGVGLLGTASTGTAIGTLSGVAATNATLAWLGGGSLAAGGFGMAGGMVVLGGIVAGPVLAVGGMMLASKAEAARDDAYSNYRKAELASEEMKTATVTTRALKSRFDEMYDVLARLSSYFEEYLFSFKILVSKNVDYSTYSDADKKGVFMLASLAKTIKTIMEAPLIDELGAITSDSRLVLDHASRVLKEIE